MNDRELETLLNDAYDDVRPAPTALNEIESRLEEHRRPSPRGLKPWLWPGAIAAAVVVAVILGRRGMDGDVAESMADRSAEFVEVRLSDGRVHIRAEETGPWAAVSLNALAKHLESRRGSGKRAVSPLRVVVRTADATPWIHVQWVMMVCAEQKMPNVELAAGKGAPVPTPLPVDLDMGARAGFGPRMQRMRITATGVVGEEPEFSVTVVEAREGEEEIEEPGEVVPNPVPNEAPADRVRGEAALARMIKNRLAAVNGKKLRVAGEIKAAHTLPAPVVVRLVRRLRAAGADPIEFYGSMLPDARIREAAKLPAPDTAWDAVQLPEKDSETKHYNRMYAARSLLADDTATAARRVQAMRTLGEVMLAKEARGARNEAFAALLRGLKIRNAEVRVAILGFLAKNIEDRNLLRVLCHMLEPTADNTPEVRVATVDALRRSVGPTSLPWLYAARDDPDAEVRRAVDAVLARYLPQRTDGGTWKTVVHTDEGAKRLAVALRETVRVRGLAADDPLPRAVVELIRDDALPFAAWHAACEWLRAGLKSFPEAVINGEVKESDRARITAAFQKRK